MTPQARVQAAIEILDAVLSSIRDDGAPADALVQRYFKTRRYAGSKDRRAVRELVFRTIRAVGEVPLSGRAAVLALAERDGDVLAAFDGGPHAPEPRFDGEMAATASLLPAWLEPHLSPLVAESERPALLDRAPLDLRVNVAKVERDVMMSRLPEAKPTTLSPWGMRMLPDTRIDDHPAFQNGEIEVQDEGSQLIALACMGEGMGRVIDLCAGAGGKALAIAAAAPDTNIVACDTNRARLSQLSPRAERAGASIQTVLLDAGKEADQLAEYRGSADVVLVDAPCSGSGTWRRNPEGRWRLNEDRLARLSALQARILDLAAPLVRPGGSLVYATCSILSEEGAAQAAAFLGRHSSWKAQDVPFEGGRADGPGRLLTPGHDDTDGFFVARFLAPC